MLRHKFGIEQREVQVKKRLEKMIKSVQNQGKRKLYGIDAL